MLKEQGSCSFYYIRTELLISDLAKSTPWDNQPLEKQIFFLKSLFSSVLTLKIVHDSCHCSAFGPQSRQTTRRRLTRSLCEAFSARNLPHNVISGCQAWVYFLAQERTVKKLFQTYNFIVSQLTRVHPFTLFGPSFLLLWE